MRRSFLQSQTITCPFSVFKKERKSCAGVKELSLD